MRKKILEDDVNHLALRCAFLALVPTMIGCAVELRVWRSPDNIGNAARTRFDWIE